MRHFVDPEMLAVNAKTIALDRTIVAEFAEWDHLPPGLISVAPARTKWKSDIEWISADDEPAFASFESAFRRLGIPDQVAPFISVDREVRLFAGFLVIRGRCSDPYFHTDWMGLNNEAFTVLTPISDNARNFGLLYRKATGEIADYEYRSGEGILFGDNFLHSTKPGASDEPVALLCFQFGTDRMEHWPAIYAQMYRQVTQVRRPDGRFVRTGVRAARRIT